MAALSNIHYVKPIEDEDFIHSPNDGTMSSNENDLMTPEREPPDIGDNALFVNYLSHKDTSSNIVLTV